jgi:hypothetical protein
MRHHLEAAVVAGSLMAATAAGATTLDFSGGFGGYTITGGKLALNGCPHDTTVHDTTPCLQYNGTQTGTLTFADGLFDLLGVKLQMQGQDEGLPNGVTFQALDAANFILGEARFYVGLGFGDIGDATVQDGADPVIRLEGYTVLFGDSFRGIASLRIFSDDPEQNVRLDDFLVQAHVVPLPTTAVLLLGGLAGLAGLRRRRAAA